MVTILKAAGPIPKTPFSCRRPGASACNALCPSLHLQVACCREAVLRANNTPRGMLARCRRGVTAYDYTGSKHGSQGTRCFVACCFLMSLIPHHYVNMTLQWPLTRLHCARELQLIYQIPRRETPGLFSTVHYHKQPETMLAQRQERG